MPTSRIGSATIGVAVIAIAAVIIFALFSIRIVDVGEVGVVHTFGVVDNNERAPGLVFKAPWASLTTMNVRTQQLTFSSRAEDAAGVGPDQTIRTLTREGLTVGLDITTLFRLRAQDAPNVFSTIGVEYVGVVVTPAIRNSIRDIVAQFTAEALYTTARTEVAVQVEEALTEALNERGVIIEDVLLRDVSLPSVITQAIELKLAAEQAIQERAFRVQEATQEAQRRIEEANGIAEANNLVNVSLTPAVLQNRYIEALAQMNAGSVVYVPTNPETGLPVILGTPTLGAGGG
jgi:regulator of protease activity HflC (stomatin/prohibitin superfamily)